MSFTRSSPSSRFGRPGGAAAGEPSRKPRLQPLRQRLVVNAGDRLGAESLEQHRFRLGLRDAARLQIENLLGVDRPDRRAVTADHVVGENLELGLRIHLRPRRQEHGLRFHRAVGLLRTRGHDHLALEGADGVIGDDRPVELAAHPARRGVDDLESRIGSAGAFEQRQSTERDFCLRAREIRKNLATAQRAARNEAKCIELRAGCQGDQLAFKMQFGIVADLSDMLELGGRGKLQRRRRMPLNAALGAEESFDDCGAGSGADRHLGPGIKRVGVIADRQMHNLDQTVERRSA